jgi:hypothetical protein
MKTFELEALGVCSLDSIELVETEGGIIPLILLAGAGVWFWRGFVVGAGAGATGAAVALA